MLSCYLILNIIPWLCGRSALEFRGQEHGYVPRAKRDRKASRSYSMTIWLDGVSDDVPRSLLFLCEFN